MIQSEEMEEAKNDHKLQRFYHYFILLDSQQSNNKNDTSEIDTMKPLFYP
jgi:hypothetical protein